MSLTRYLTEYSANNYVNEKLDTKLFFLQTMKKIVKFSHLNKRLVSTIFFFVYTRNIARGNPAAQDCLSGTSVTNKYK